MSTARARSALESFCDSLNKSCRKDGDHIKERIKEVPTGWLLGTVLLHWNLLQGYEEEGWLVGGDRPMPKQRLGCFVLCTYSRRRIRTCRYSSFSFNTTILFFITVAAPQNFRYCNKKKDGRVEGEGRVTTGADTSSAVRTKNKAPQPVPS
nr:hypothetical protein [Tanacetum cinerariifolium]